jgi:ankyrin repeat protein
MGGGNRDISGEDRIIDAARAGDVDELRRILERQPELAGARNAAGETPIIAALYRGQRAVVDLLLDAGVHLDVFAAAATGRLAALANALSQDPHAVNAFAFDGWTPLHLAAFFGHASAVDLLLDAGADLGAVSRNSLKNTPLHAATAGGHADVALRLLERGAPADVADAGGHTPLHIAAENGSVPVVRALLDRGADPHLADAEDQTPLSRAAARNHAAVIDLINMR